ncbi:MAG: sigma factor-like helix-turn-helix DNA-binding protein [Clostridia bacterium]
MKEDKLYISIYNDYYGMLLTKHQTEIVGLYYDCDVSLNEIAEQYNISRQAVRDTLVRAENLLEDYESKLNLVQNDKVFANELQQIIGKIDKSTKEEIKIELQNLQNRR